MTRDGADVQFDVLTAMMVDRTPAWVFLVNGIKLSGVIDSTVIQQHAHPVKPTRATTNRPRRTPV